MDTQLLMDAKRRRDVLRDALITALREYELPDELKALLSEDQEATADLERVWMQYQVNKAVREAVH